MNHLYEETWASLLGAGVNLAHPNLCYQIPEQVDGAATARWGVVESRQSQALRTALEPAEVARPRPRL